MVSALINVPKTAKHGEIIEIKTLMSHIMETGYRHTATGAIVPRDIITGFICRYNGAEIFRADLFPAIAANPFISFFTTATESGKFEFEWIGDNGFSETASASLPAESAWPGPYSPRCWCRVPSAPPKSRGPNAAPATASRLRVPRR